jgi:hypothetical protein
MAEANGSEVRESSQFSQQGRFTTKMHLVKNCLCRMICPPLERAVFGKDERVFSQNAVFEYVFVLKFLSYEVFATGGNALN